jgi:pimeloyl-ACP methyl ester carboxylesterase
VTGEARRALDSCRTGLLAVCGLASILRGIDEEVAEIDVPVFVGVGDRDIAGSPGTTAEALRLCPDITLFVLAGAGHNHNVARGRTALWDRLAAWIDGCVGVRPSPPSPHCTEA